MKFKIRIANKNISIHSIYSSVYYSCKEYIVDDNEKTDIFVYVTEDMIEKELIRFLKYDNYVNDTYVPSKSYLEIILIHKIIAEAILDYNTFLMHGAVIAVDGFSYILDPAYIVQQIHTRIGNRVIIGSIVPCSRGQSLQCIKIYDMRRGFRQHMRDPDKGNCFLNGHFLTVDIARPHIADPLFALKIILCDMLHGDGCILKMLYLPLGCIPVLKVGIKNHKNQHNDHDEYIDNYNPCSFHGVLQSPAIFFSRNSAHFL